MGGAVAGRRLLVGLDVGTTSSKAVVFDEAGVAVASGRAPMPWVTTPTGAELDPTALRSAAVDALGRALAGAPDGVVAGLGVAGMGESGVLLDSAGVPLGPLLAWHDTRDDAELSDLRARIDPTRFAQTTGLPLRQQWSLTKHRWLLTHHPGTGRAVRRLNVAEWIVRSLGGEEGCEQSLASRTGWLRLSSRDWWSESLAWSGASRSLMPALVEAGTALGVVGADVGLGRLTGAALTVAGHDHQVAAIGAGAVGDGDELDSCGTAEALVRTVSPGLAPATVGRLAEGGVTVGWHALPGRWCLLGGTTGGLVLQQALASLDEGGGDPDGVWQAAVEGVTDEVATIHDAMSAVTGPHRNFVVTGGWSRNAALMAAKARHFGILSLPEVTEAGARGAALLAGLAAGVYSTTADFPRLPARAGTP